MVLSTEELFEAVGIQLAVKLGAEVDMVDFVDMQIGFAINSKDDQWIEGIVKVDYDTDLGVYVKWDEDGDYTYQFDINWCDLLEGIE